MTGLSDDDIREAAAEAGISPAQLRQALAEQGRDLPAKVGALAPPAPVRSLRGAVVASARADVPMPPGDAVRGVRSAIEAQIGQTGHMHGGNEAALYDEPRGVIYRLYGEDDGQGGAMVRVDVDAAPARGRLTAATLVFGTGLLVLGLVSLVLGSVVGIMVTAGLTGLGGVGLAAATRAKRGAYQQAHAIASHALLEAEERAVATRALPPG
jgi:hypothetical protein